MTASEQSSLKDGVLKWAFKGGEHSEISEDGLAFTKKGGKETVGARTRTPLPLDATWHIKYNRVGSVTSLGIGLEDCDLQVDGYANVFGKDLKSWALTFNKKWGKHIEEFSATHDGTSKILTWNGSCEGDDPLFKFRFANGKELYVILPGESDEVCIFPDLPSQPFYVVADAIFNNSSVAIADPADGGKSSLPEAPKHMMDGKGKPKLPAAAISPSVQFVDAFDKVGEGDWQLQMGAKSESKTYTEVEQLEPSKLKELEYLVEHCRWGDCEEVVQCFDRKHMDDGIVTNMPAASLKCPDLQLSYWEASRGGNATGILLEVSDSPTALVENCDTDMIWKGAGCDPTPKAFVNQFKKARYS